MHHLQDNYCKDAFTSIYSYSDLYQPVVRGFARNCKIILMSIAPMHVDNDDEV
jgi:hypothetical protein